jgi:hypothetical protein
MTTPDPLSTGVHTQHQATVPAFLRVVVADEKPASAQAVAEQAILALNSSMLRLYDEALEKFKQIMRDRVPIILALFSGTGGQMILYRPGSRALGAAYLSAREGRRAQQYGYL